MTDIYAICKIINIRLKDVVRVCGGQILTDSREKERFSFQVYGIEEARNWAFHGEGVSAVEVLTNLNFLISISKSLGCEQRFQAKFLDLFRTLKNSMGNKLNACESFIETRKGPCQAKTVDRHSMQAHLLVLADVCSETVWLVCQLVQNAIHSCIITTRGSAVKLQLQRKIASAKFLHMKPFSVDESCQLITRRGAAKTLTSTSLSVWKDALGSVLGNIPLCVSVLSSLSLKNTGDFDTGSVEVVKRNWSKIEEEFGDRFHSRGLNGVIELAMDSLQCSPQAFFMLAIICSLEAERVPWDLLCQEQPKYCRIECFTLNFVRNSKTQMKSTELAKFVDGWFQEFLKAGNELALPTRQLLEEVGLISWNSETRTVHIHGLTLSIVQQKFGGGLYRLLTKYFSSLPAYFEALARRLSEYNEYQVADFADSFFLPFWTAVFSHILVAGSEVCARLIKERDVSYLKPSELLPIYQVLLSFMAMLTIPYLWSFSTYFNTA